MSHLIELFLERLRDLGPAAYAILFGVIFVETGVVILPFLPGDSLLFAVGAAAGQEKPLFQIGALYPLLMAAALLGDNCNYYLGSRFGRRLFVNESSKLFRRSNLEKTEQFFVKHGAKAVVLARFVPIVRTFAPFVAGMGAMTYRRFLTFSVLGAALWVGTCVTAGYFFGQLPFVRKYLELVLIGIVLISILPPIIEYINHRRIVRPD